MAEIDIFINSAPIDVEVSAAQGPAGAAGAAGPNTITTSTTTNLTGFISGNGTTIAATAAATAATADTLVLRTGTGAASFVGITASGLITDTQPTDATTPVNAFTAATSTAAGFNAQKWSPVIKQSAKGWGTTAGTSQDVSFSTIVKPTQSTVPTGTWSLQSSIAGGALTDQLTVSSTGVTSSAVAFSAPIYYGVNSSGGILRLDGNAATRGLGIGSLNLVAWSSGAYSGGSVSGDTNLNRSAAGILQIGTTSANALGSLACFNGTFGGTLTASGNAAFYGIVEFNTEEFTYGSFAAEAHRIALGGVSDSSTGTALFGAATAAEANSYLATIKIAASDDNRTAAVYVDDSELFVTLGVGSWLVDVKLLWGFAGGSVVAYRLQFSGVISTAVPIGHLLTRTATSGQPVLASGYTESVDNSSHAAFLLLKVTTSGVFKIDHRNNNATGTSTRRAGSAIIARKIS